MGIDLDLIIGDYGKEDFICSVCADLLFDPVTLKSCEHNFCRLCIGGVVRTGNLRCPDCRVGSARWNYFLQVYIYDTIFGPVRTRKLYRLKNA